MVQCCVSPIFTCSGLRLACEADLPRLAELSVLGFKDSEIFRYTRPQYAEFPQDAIASFADRYRAQLCDPRTLVLVSEDCSAVEELDDCETGAKLTAAANAASDPAQNPAHVVVVGVASWVLPGPTPRAAVSGGMKRPFPHCPNRDSSPHRQHLLQTVVDNAQRELLGGQMICDKLVVHPAYRGRGHATRMLQWGLAQAVQHGVDQGVIPSHMGEPVYLGLGYEIVGEVRVPADEGNRGFSLRVLSYRVRSSE